LEVIEKLEFIQNKDFLKEKMKNLEDSINSTKGEVA